jgi:carbonic anhydrase
MDSAHVKKEQAEKAKGSGGSLVKGQEPLTSKGGKPMVGEKEIQRLLEGNKRFVSGEVTDKRYPARRAELLEGQHPFVTMVACSDSRVDPTAIFDANLGEMFAIETAGNIVDEISLGSIEYGVDHLHTPLLVVLSHTKCGAVTATCKGGHAEGNLRKVVEKIKPAAEKAENDINRAIDINAEMVVEDILARSPVVKKAVDEGKTKIVIMKYHLEDGTVELKGAA